MEPLRVVIGADAEGVAAFDAAVARGGVVLAVAPAGSPLAAHAGARNVDGEAVASVVIFADELIDLES
jgi:hypothetical protein